MENQIMQTFGKTLTRTQMWLALSAIAVMALTFTLLGGLPLIVTFDVGLFVVATIVVLNHLGETAFPEAQSYYPIYFATLAWQFIHFIEEFMTGFREHFPALYGADAYSANLFEAINMISYAGFTLAGIAFLTKGIRFLIAPMLFFVVYGALGNAIAHTWWVIWLGKYFPGFYTAQVYWILGPLALAGLVGSLKRAVVFTVSFGLILIPVTTVFMVS
jgi:hypothetical protein